MKWPILPGSTDRAIFVGKTGCGKTTLAQRIVSRYQHAIVLDVKGEMTRAEWPGFEIYSSFDNLRKADKGITQRIYQPNIFEQNAEMYDQFFRWIYERRNTCVYVDEVLGVCKTWSDIPFYYKGILTRGRQRGIACLQATQTPMSVPHALLSQSEIFYVFFCKMPQDREKIAKITGISEDSQAALTDYEFLVATDSDYSLKKRRLKL